MEAMVVEAMVVSVASSNCERGKGEWCASALRAAVVN